MKEEKNICMQKRKLHEIRGNRFHAKEETVWEKRNTFMRYHTLDNLRALNLISMIAYHFSWDMVYLFGADWQWYRSEAAYIWQQSICWIFILLSGFCWSMGHRKWRRGLEVFAGGICITAVTLLFMPDERVLFGVLTCLGSCMLLMILAEEWLKRVPAKAGILVALGLFFVFRNVNEGYLGFERVRLLSLPEGWYRTLGTAYLGFPAAGFYSTDYFSILPWFFLFAAGYFLYRIVNESGKISCLQGKRVLWMEWLGQHSLLIYMLHQPVIYLVLMVCFAI